MKIFRFLQKISEKKVVKDHHAPPPFLPEKSQREDTLNSIFDRYPKKTYDKGKIVREKSASIDAVYIIAEGCLLLEAYEEYGRRTVQFNAGDIVGYIDQNNNGHLLSLIAAKRTVLVEVSREEFEKISGQLKYVIYEKLYSSLLKIYQTLTSNISSINSSNKILLSRLNYIESKRKDITSSKLVENVIHDIPKLPTFTADLLSKLLNENTSVQEVTELIRKDPPLAGAILRNVNSAYYGLPRKIASIHHAIAYLGFKNIYQIVLNSFIGSIFPDKEEFYNIQNHSILISIISQEISLASRKIKSSNPTTIGILHDIGKIVVLLLKEKFPDMAEFFDILDEAVIGAKLLEQWELPESVHQIIKNQHLPEFYAPDNLDSEYKADIAILYLSHVYYGMLTNHSMSSTIYLNEYMSLLNVPQKAPGTFYQEIVIPGLIKNRQRLPESIRNLLMQQLMTEK